MRATSSSTDTVQCVTPSTVAPIPRPSVGPGVVRGDPCPPVREPIPGRSTEGQFGDRPSVLGTPGMKASAPSPARAMGVGRLQDSTHRRPAHEPHHRCKQGHGGKSVEAVTTQQARPRRSPREGRGPGWDGEGRAGRHCSRSRQDGGWGAFAW